MAKVGVTRILPVLFEKSAVSMISEKMLGQSRCEWNIACAFGEKCSEYDKGEHAWPRSV